MANPTSLVYYSSQVAEADVYTLSLVLEIESAGIPVGSPRNSAQFSFTNALTAQSQVDNFLGTTGEFDYTVFTGTAMQDGTEKSVGMLINMDGQCKAVHGFSMIAAASPGTTVFQGKGVSQTLSNASQINQIQVGAEGNIGLMTSDIGLTAAWAAGTVNLHIDIHWSPK